MTKPVFEVDIDKIALSSLEAHAPLSLLMDHCCHHAEKNLRMPLGIYNISVSRVCDKVARLCQRLETYFKASTTLESLPANDDVMHELIDYIELSLYAAAEHVDDINSIATGLYTAQVLRDGSALYKELQKQVKRQKRLISAAANAIKHQQSRIRVFAMEFAHGGSSGCLHGYFIEGVEAGTVCPSKTFHQTQEVFSITTLVWEIVMFLLDCSRALARFLDKVGTQALGPPYARCDGFKKTVVAAARLPIYTFGEEHPFSRMTLRVLSSDDNEDSLCSGLYGSIRSGWTKDAVASFGPYTSVFEGDGKSRIFRFAQPKTVSLQHWQ